MPSKSDKWIRSIKDNPAGKVVADPEGNRWEWQSDDETSHQLNKLSNEDLAIESTNLHPKLERPDREKSASPAPKRSSRPLKPGARDSGGGFNPYDHAGKKRR
jgi:hypothetical protein